MTLLRTATARTRPASCGPPSPSGSGLSVLSCTLRRRRSCVCHARKRERLSCRYQTSIDCAAAWKMKVVALRRRSSGSGVKPPTAALAEDRCRERVGKGAHDASGGDREGERKRIAADVSKLVLGGIRTGVSTRLQDESGGDPVYWPGGARHIGDASPVCGFHVERGKAGPDTAASSAARGSALKRAEPARR